MDELKYRDTKRIDNFGRIVIPMSVRKALGIKIKDKIIVELGTDGVITLKKKTD